MHDDSSVEYVQKSVMERLRANDPEFIRLDITSNLFAELDQSGEIADFLKLFPSCPTIESVHLSGKDLERYLTPDQIKQVAVSVGSMDQLEDLSVFKGKVLNERVLTECLSRNQGLHALLLFQFDKLQDHPELAGVLRRHPNLERITVTLSITKRNQYQWGCMDVYAMAFCQMAKLRVLQIRCKNAKQDMPIISPEGGSALFSSPIIEKLYLENVGLLDDHFDVMETELEKSSIAYLQLSDNKLSEDALYTIARMLPKLTKLKSLDVSGVHITNDAGEAIAAAMAHNTTIINLELEGDAIRYQNEFDIPVGFSLTEWSQQIYYYIRLNRAQPGGPRSVQKSKYRFVEALNSVSDQLDCLYFFLQECPHHFGNHPKSILELIH